MSLKQDLESAVNGTLSRTWSSRNGTTVPTTDKVALAGGAVKLAATILYADLADSTALAVTQDRRVAAKVYKSFLLCSSKIIRSHSGHIRSFDGDRVMGVFVGSTKDTNAAKCALQINWAFLNIVKPKLEVKYASLKDGNWTFAHCVGVDTSDVLVVRSGIRDNNDLVWVGRAPNVAAKLSAIRAGKYHSYITKAVYNGMNDEVKYVGKTSIWQACKWNKVKGVEDVYRSIYTWPLT
jgi:class 3 adenylate cyclase